MFVAEFQYACFTHTYIFYLLRQDSTAQLSKQCLFVNAGWYMGSYSADVDLRFGCPQSDILEQISWVLIYQPQEDGHLS